MRHAEPCVDAGNQTVQRVCKGKQNLQAGRLVDLMDCLCHYDLLGSMGSSVSLCLAFHGNG